MLKAIFYKEWIKTRRIALLAAGIFLCFIIYTFIDTAQQFRVVGAVDVWTNVVQKDILIIPGLVKYLPLLVGVALGFAQFGPEVADKRLKLTLHLPMAESKTVAMLLIYGLSLLVTIFVVTYLALIGGMSAYYPIEVISAMFWKTLPWFMGGIVTYLFISWIALEPIWKQRIFNALIAVVVLTAFFIRARSGAYVPFLPYMIVTLLIAFALPFYSTARFKEGAQR